MRMIKSLKSNKPLATLSAQELTTVKGGGVEISINSPIYKLNRLNIAGDPPPEIEQQRCFFGS